MAKIREFILINACNSLKSRFSTCGIRKRGCKPLVRFLKIYFFTAPFLIKKQLLAAKSVVKMGDS